MPKRGRRLDRAGWKFAASGMSGIQFQVAEPHSHSDCDGQLVFWFASLRFRQRGGGEQQDTYAFGEQYWEDIGEHQQRVGVDEILFVDCAQSSSDSGGGAKRIADSGFYSECGRN